MMIIGMPKEVTVTFEEYKRLVAHEFIFISRSCFHVGLLAAKAAQEVTESLTPSVRPSVRTFFINKQIWSRVVKRFKGSQGYASSMLQVSFKYYSYMIQLCFKYTSNFLQGGYK